MTTYKSLDAGGGCVFRIMTDPAMVEIAPPRQLDSFDR